MIPFPLPWFLTGLPRVSDAHVGIAFLLALVCAVIGAVCIVDNTMGYDWKAEFQQRDARTNIRVGFGWVVLGVLSVFLGLYLWSLLLLAGIVVLIVLLVRGAMIAFRR